MSDTSNMQPVTVMFPLCVNLSRPITAVHLSYALVGTRAPVAELLTPRWSRRLTIPIGSPDSSWIAMSALRGSPKLLHWQGVLRWPAGAYRPVAACEIRSELTKGGQGGVRQDP